MTPFAHRQLHKKGFPRSEATKKAIGDSLKGIPLSEAHKKAKKTVRVGEITKTVEAALEKYPEHVGNKLQREEIRKKESEARDAYIKEKRKHQTVIDLQR